MGSLSRGSSSDQGLVMSFSGCLIHHWSPPDTQLSPMASRSDLHVTVATSQKNGFDRLAKPGENNQQVSNPQ